MEIQHTIKYNYLFFKECKSLNICLVYERSLCSGVQTVPRLQKQYLGLFILKLNGFQWL